MGNIYSQDKAWKFAFCYYYQSYLIRANLSVSNNVAVALRKLEVKGPSNKLSWEEYFQKEHSEREMGDWRELFSLEEGRMKEMSELGKLLGLDLREEGIQKVAAKKY